MRIASGFMSLAGQLFVVTDDGTVWVWDDGEAGTAGISGRWRQLTLSLADQIGPIYKVPTNG